MSNKRKTEELREKLSQCYIVHHKTQHGLSWARTRPSAVSGQRLSLGTAYYYYYYYSLGSDLLVLNFTQ